MQRKTTFNTDFNDPVRAAKVGHFSSRFYFPFKKGFKMSALHRWGIVYFSIERRANEWRGGGFSLSHLLITPTIMMIHFSTV